MTSTVRSKTPRGLRQYAAALFLCGAVGAAADSPRFVPLGIDAQLPGYTTWSVEQDTAGFIWIATVDGLARFDGQSLKTFPTQTSRDALNDSFSRVLHRDTRGQLWIGTDAGGLSRHVADDRFETYRYDVGDADSLNSDRVLSLASQAPSTLWIGTDNGLARLDTETGQFKRHLADPDTKGALPNATVRSLLVSSDGTLWVGTGTGLVTYSATRRAFESVGETTIRSRVIALHEDDQHAIWAGTADGTYRFDSRTQQFLPVPAAVADKVVVSMEYDGRDLWFGTLSHGLVRWRASSGDVNHYRYDRNAGGLGDDVVVSLRADRGGVLWIGTFNSGVYTLDTNGLAFGREDNSPSSVACMNSLATYAFHADETGALWIGTDDGLVRYDKSNGHCDYYGADYTAKDQLPAGVLSIAPGEGQTLWLGTQLGLAQFDRQSKRPLRLDPPVTNEATYFVAPHPSGGVLVGTEQGLLHYLPREGQARPVPTNDGALALARFAAVAPDDAGRAWFATSGGVAYLDDSGQLHSLQLHAEGEEPPAVTALFHDHDSSIWIGLENQGLWQIDRRGNVLRRHTEKTGFPVTMVVGAILPDTQDGLWVSTLAGLVKLDSSRAVARVYSAEDGLQGSRFSVGAGLALETGQMFFGGRSGFNAFFPSDVSDNPVPPAVVLNDLTLWDDVAVPGKPVHGLTLPAPLDRLTSLQLEAHHRIFSIGFAALDYAAPSRVRYAYRLEGLDPKWRQAGSGEHRATFTNLDPGTYRFSVRAANKDGVWNTVGRHLDIVVHPPIGATWWAKSLYALLIATIILAAARMRDIAQRRYAESLEQEVAVRTREVEQQKAAIAHLLSRKNALFENVSHELRTPLTLVIGPLEQMRSELADERNERRLDMALRSSRRLLGMVEHLLTLADSSADESMARQFRDVAPAIHMQLAAFSLAARHNEVELVAGTIEDARVFISHDGLETIFGNLLANGIKYSGPGSRIEVSGRIVGDEICLLVEDNGAGMHPNETEVIFERFKRLAPRAGQSGTGLGLAVTREVVEANGGQIRCESELGKGTRFYVTLPLATTQDTTAQWPTAGQNVLPNIEPVAPVGDASDSADVPQSEDIATVLVVDDSQDVRDFIRSVLEVQFRVLIAENGRQGIEQARTHMPDAVVCDVMMPDIDGYEVSRRLRDDQLTSHIPILILTARSDRESRLRAWRETADEYLQKPFDDEELQLRLTNLIAIRRMLRDRLAQQHENNLPLTSTDLCQQDQEFLEKLERAVASGYANLTYGRSDIAAQMALSERQLLRKLKALIGCSPSHYLRDYRLRRAAELLGQGTQVALVAERCGFTTPSYFAKCFREKYGETPKKFQTGVVARGRS